MRYFAFFRERPLTAFALCYGAGVVAAYLTAFIPWAAAAGLLSGIMITVILRLYRKSILPGVCTALFFLGLLLCGNALNPVLPPEGRYTVAGTVDGTVKQDESGKNKTYLRDVILTDGEGNERKAGKAYLTLTPDTEGLMPEDGQRLCFSGKVYHPSAQENPYGFDFRLFLLTKGSGYGISAYTDPEITGRDAVGLKGTLLRWREILVERSREIFGEQSALPTALLLGEREELPEETRAAFSDAGIAHILAVSGLHVSLLAGAILALLKRIGMSPWLRLAVMTVFLLLYCGIVGFSAPVVRASLLTFIMLLSVCVIRRTDPLTTLSAAFLLILLIRPTELFTVSFILSFSAVLGIVLFGDLFGSWHPRRKIAVRAWNLWQTTFAASCGVTLPVICFFHSVSLIGFVINPAVCALIGVLLPVYAVIFLIGCVWLPAGVFLGRMIGYVTAAFTDAVTLLSNLPYAVVRVATPSVAVILLLTAGLILLTRYVLIRKRIRIPCACVLIAGAIALFIFGQDHSLRYIQFSSGQADCAVITDSEATVVLDTGEDGGDLCSYLLGSGLRADMVIITHLHADHAGGLEKLIANDIPIGVLYLPAEAERHVSGEAALLPDRMRERGIEVRYLSRGDTFSSGTATYTVLWPEAGRQYTDEDANEYSLSLYIDFGGTAMLQMADVDSMYEQYAATEADLLKVAHHGSGNGTGREMLDTVRPGAAVITSSRFSSTLPNAETLQRLDENGISVYRTDETGAVTIRFDGQHYTVTTFRGVE